MSDIGATDSKIEIRPDVMDFAVEIERALRRHDWTKGDSYKRTLLGDLLSKLYGETGETIFAPLDEIPGEAVDVGAIAMMVWYAANRDRSNRDNTHQKDRQQEAPPKGQSPGGRE